MERNLSGVCRAWLLLAIAVACRHAAGGELLRVHDTQTPMGTYMSIIVYAPSEAVGKSAIRAAFARVEAVEAATSTYRAKSDISLLNKAAGGPDLAVSLHLWQPVHRALEIARETGGAFDPTVGPLVALWRKTWKLGKLPADADVEAARALVDYRLVRLDVLRPRLSLAKAGMRLTLSGIAKGYAVDQAVAVLRERGIPAALVDAGGDMCAYGVPPGRTTWLVGVRDPSRPGHILPHPLRLLNAAIATSGDYEQFGTVDGKRYSHILDPRTGRPIQGMTSVTVFAPDATTADAFATAASVLGVEKALALSEKHPKVEMMILRRDKDEIRRDTSSGFADLEVKDTDTP
ncbi:FAD:protein FMN transferase [bacterium]|nr:FAD:protein FMN transferase [bacterium]